MYQKERRGCSSETTVVTRELLKERPKSAMMRLTNIGNKDYGTNTINLPSVESAVSQFVQLNQRHRSASSSNRNVSVPSHPSEQNQTGNEPARIRYTHGVKDDAITMSNERYKTMTLLYHELAMDSVDVVFDANKPDSAKRTLSPKKLIVGSPVLEGMQAQIESLNESFARQCAMRKSRSLPEAESFRNLEVLQSSVSSAPPRDVTKETSVIADDNRNIPSPEDQNIEIKSNEQSAETKHICRKKQNKHRAGKKKKTKEPEVKTEYAVTDGLISPDIHRDAYIRALQDARSKYFRKTPPNTFVTEPFKFSYFDVTNKYERGRSQGERDFRNYVGMRRIFGDIRLDDYYSPRYLAKYITKRPEV